MFNKKSILYLLVFILSSNLAAVTVVYGDSRSQPEIHQQIVNQLIKYKPVAVFHTGDMNTNGMRQSEYDNFFSILKPLTDSSRFYPVKGNHEKNLELYLSNFPELKGQTYYTATEDSIVWIIMDSTIKLGPGSPQYKWLQAKLELHKQSPMIILMHHPVFSSGEHGDELGLSFFLPALLKDYPVLAVFCGHDHIYERSEYKGQFYIVTGGAGAPLYRADSRNDYSKKIYLGHNFCVLNYQNAVLDVKVYDLEGKQIDEFSAPFKALTRPAETEK